MGQLIASYVRYIARGPRTNVTNDPIMYRIGTDMYSYLRRKVCFLSLKKKRKSTYLCLWSNTGPPPDMEYVRYMNAITFITKWSPSNGVVKPAVSSVRTHTASTGARMGRHQVISNSTCSLCACASCSIRCCSCSEPVEGEPGGEEPGFSAVAQTWKCSM